MIVYRIQDSDGRGPWKPGFSDQWVEDRPDHDNLVPWPHEFGNVQCRALSWEHIGAGCKTIEQLQRWFTRSEYETLLGFGYHAVKMTVARILAQSDIQCVFTRRIPLAEQVESFTLYPDTPNPTTTDRANVACAARGLNSTPRGNLFGGAA